MITDLFFDANSCINMDLPDADIVYYPTFIDGDQADRFYHALYEQLQWSQQSIRLYGKQHQIPRLSAWYADDGKSYEYSGLKTSGLPWIPVLSEIRQLVQLKTDTEFNSVLANLYRDQSDSVGWHADDEPELGEQPVIASVSFGQQRKFHLKHKTNKTLKTSIGLDHGSLLIMQGDTQKHWLHQVSKSSQAMDGRINLTFRKVN